MAINKEAIISASAKISQLREELARAKSDLKREETLLDRLLAGDESTSATNDIVKSPRTYDFDMTLNERIIGVVEGDVLRAFDAEEVAAELKDANIASVRSALPRLADAKKILRAERGRYQSRKAVFVRNIRDGGSQEGTAQ